MFAATRARAAIFVDSAAAADGWIVRDPDGNFWTVPSSDNAWESRSPYDLKQDRELVPVPGHYKYLIGLPF